MQYIVSNPSIKQIIAGQSGYVIVAGQTGDDIIDCRPNQYVVGGRATDEVVRSGSEDCRVPDGAVRKPHGFNLELVGKKELRDGQSIRGSSDRQDQITS